MNQKVKAEIREACQNWVTAFNNHDIDTLMSLYDPECNYCSNAGPRKHDLPTIRKGFTEHFMLKPKAFINEEQVIAGTDLGYWTGNFIMKATNPEDQSKMEEKGRVVVVFRKSAAGEWKLVFDMDNRPPDVQ